MNIRSINLIIAVCIVFLAGFAFAAPNESATTIIGDVNSDGQVDLADILICLQISAGAEAGGSALLEADVNGDHRINLMDAIFDMQWLSGITGPEEEWTADIYDASSQLLGTLNFVLRQAVSGEVVADGDYSVEYGDTITGDFTNQPVTIEGNQITSVYSDTVTLPPAYGGFSVQFTLLITGTTDCESMAGTWAVDFDHLMVPDMAGTWAGERTSGSGIIR